MPSLRTQPIAKLNELFQNTIARGEEISKRELYNNAPARELALSDIQDWDNYNLRFLRQAFTSFEEAEEYPIALNTHNPSTSQIVADIERRIRYLKNLKDRLELYDERSQGTASGPTQVDPRNKTSIFIVHGHQEVPKQEVARYLQAVTSLTPAILHELPKSGRTIIEGLERAAADSAFAVVLLTADDEGRARNSPQRNPRARQNVVFELGLFIGLLGRSNVAVLYEPGVELPSDLDGILYTVLDDTSAWKLSLARELLAAGISVDLNKAI